MKTTRLHKVLPGAIALAAVGVLSAPAVAEKYPSKPIELICTTSPGSGAAQWCHMVAKNLSTKAALGVPVNVSFKSA